MIAKMDIKDIYKLSHPASAKYNFFSAAMELHPK
jgi:hypothetical protein